MPQLENSEVVKCMLTILINISGRKTTAGHAVSTMDTLIKRLAEKYDFLKHVEINDTRFSEIGDLVTVMSNINTVESNEMGEALHAIIRTMNESLGKDAGYFFIKELQSSLEDEFHSAIEEMGVNLSFMQLEQEIDKLEKKLK